MRADDAFEWQPLALQKPESELVRTARRRLPARHRGAVRVLAAGTFASRPERDGGAIRATALSCVGQPWNPRLVDGSNPRFWSAGASYFVVPVPDLVNAYLEAQVEAGVCARWLDPRIFGCQPRQGGLFRVEASEGGFELALGQQLEIVATLRLMPRFSPRGLAGLPLMSADGLFAGFGNIPVDLPSSGSVVALGGGDGRWVAPRSWSGPLMRYGGGFRFGAAAHLDRDRLTGLDRRFMGMCGRGGDDRNRVGLARFFAEDPGGRWCPAVRFYITIGRLEMALRRTNGDRVDAEIYLRDQETFHPAPGILAEPRERRAVCGLSTEDRPHQGEILPMPWMTVAAELQPAIPGAASRGFVFDHAACLSPEGQVTDITSQVFRREVVGTVIPQTLRDAHFPLCGALAGAGAKLGFTSSALVFGYFDSTTPQAECPPADNPVLELSNVSVRLGKRPTFEDVVRVQNDTIEYSYGLLRPAGPNDIPPVVEVF